MAVMAVAARERVQAANAVPKVMTHLLWGEKDTGETSRVALEIPTATSTHVPGNSGKCV